MNTKFQHAFLISFLSLSFISCSQRSDSKSSSSKSSAESGVSQEPVVEDTTKSENNEHSKNQDSVELYSQSFENFELNRNWMLSDFDLNGEKDKELYVQDGELKFDIRWTKRTRNHLADILGYERKDMNHQMANSLCEPKIEIGKERVYTNSNSNNQIAELDTDLKHCLLNGNDPATISLRSFVPTKIGYKYSVKIKYMMRSYGSMTDKSYKNLVLRFGNSLEKFDPKYDEFFEASLDMLATRNFSKLVITDNGLPDSFGILIDDIVILEHGKVENYDACAELFNLNSRGFKKCIQGEVETEKICSISDLEGVIVKTSKVKNVANDRRDLNNIFLNSPAQKDKINFFSLGVKGKVKIACAIDGHPALFPIFGKTLSLREISWGNKNVNSYPELAKIRVKLEDCDDETLNRTVTIGTVETAQNFSLTFDEDENGRSYSGCKMNKLIIKDITPKGPSKDGFDLNSLQIL